MIGWRRVPAPAKNGRFVICFNSEVSERDAAILPKIIARIEAMIIDSRQFSHD
jgi:hypothetical protein